MLNDNALLLSMCQINEVGLPKVVSVYRQRYEAMSRPEYKLSFKQFADDVLKDTFEGQDWKDLLLWEHRHLQYSREQLPVPRAEMPIDIIKQSKGRCGEFALLYNGLLVTEGYRCRIIIDCSKIQEKSKTAAGDHVWNEVNTSGSWLHIDPTERRINQPLMYSKEWNKDINLIYAIDEKTIIDVTSKYKS